MLSRISRSLDRLVAHQGFRRYLFNTSWRFSEQVFRILTELLVGVYVARYLGPEQFGVYSYVIVFAGLFGSISKLGLDGILVRDLVSHPDKRDLYLGTAFWLKLMGTLLMLIVLALAVQLSSNDATTNLYISVIACGFLFQSFEVMDFYFQSQVLSKYVSISKLIQLALSSMFKLYFVFIGADLFWFVLLSLVDQICLAAFLSFCYWQHGMGSFMGHFSVETAKGMLANSWPLMLSGVAVMLYMRIDQVMIKEMLGEREVGLYSAAIRLSEAWYFVPVIITTSLFPAIVNAKTNSEHLYQARLQQLYAMLVWMAIVVAVLMTFVSDWLIALLYGAAYKDAVYILIIHIWAGVFVSIGVASGSWFITENLQRYALYRTALGALINVLLNVVLIAKYGLIGAAVATVIAQAMAALFFDALMEKTRAMFYMKLKALYLPNVIQRA